METYLDHSPLHIGCRVIPSRYFLAPLAGYTQRAFRLAVRELSGLGRATIDLVLALLHSSKKSSRLIRTADCDRSLTVQLYGGDPHTMAEAAKWLVDRGYDGIDLNLGCPIAKVNRPAAKRGENDTIRKAIGQAVILADYQQGVGDLTDELCRHAGHRQ